jgi:hypothetical protein
MNNFKTKIAILAISFVSFVGIQSASAIEGLSIGAAYNTSGFMATGKETQGGTTTITEEDGAFTADYASVFVEFAVSDQFSLGLERHLEDITTPQNQNEKNGKNNLVKATFKDHTTLYANINMPFNTYFKLGYSVVDVATEESLATGGSYPDVDTNGVTAGFGYNVSMDNGMFFRAEISATSYDDVSATNATPDVAGDADVVTVTDMYGASATFRIGKSF